eukprot:Blabericola_migrator_1__906@NODE_1223_length_5062_cov_15_623223_g830_i0_p1_GENE_NODE_1223_length_5062_cov_15_623223_g830_i0NODE_1223_length_5062_cov_15_623223_g830_i0_p1_ORF_typecomplete_len436_score65_90Glycos_transf_2/PF00535_26/0_026AadA_C/PF18280_1/1_5AadA_C/PF18280_1/2_8e02_NODE_1223_length_5062_cov_15_623223_g830_i02391546
MCSLVDRGLSAGKSQPNDPVTTMSCPQMHCVHNAQNYCSRTQRFSIMSARFFQGPDLINHDKQRALNAAMLVVLAVNPSIQNSSALHLNSGHDAHVEAPSRRRQWSAANSVGLLYAKEEGQGEPRYVPSILRLVDPDLIVDRDALQKVLTAVNESPSDLDLQELINKCFPTNDFSKHLFSHLKVFLAGKPFLPVGPPRDRSWLMRKLKAAPTESVEILDAESSVALKHIENAQRWFAVHFRTAAHIMYTSLAVDFYLWGIRRDGTLMRKPGTPSENPVYSGLTVVEIKESLKMSGHFKRVAGQLIAKTKILKAKLDPKSRRELSKYSKTLDFIFFDGLIGPFQLRKRLHSIQWMLGFGPPIFFANHRNEFAEVMDLLTQYSGATNGLSTQLLKNLSFLGRAMRDLSADPADLIPLEEHWKTLVAHKHWIAPYEPL